MNLAPPSLTHNHHLNNINDPSITNISTLSNTNYTPYYQLSTTQPPMQTEEGYFNKTSSSKFSQSSYADYLQRFPLTQVTPASNLHTTIYPTSLSTFKGIYTTGSAMGFACDFRARIMAMITFSVVLWAGIAISEWFDNIANGVSQTHNVAAVWSLVYIAILCLFFFPWLLFTNGAVWYCCYYACCYHKKLHYNHPKNASICRPMTSCFYRYKGIIESVTQLWILSPQSKLKNVKYRIEEYTNQILTLPDVSITKHHSTDHSVETRILPNRYDAISNPIRINSGNTTGNQQLVEQHNAAVKSFLSDIASASGAQQSIDYFLSQRKQQRKNLKFMVRLEIFEYVTESRFRSLFRQNHNSESDNDSDDDNSPIIGELNEELDNHLLQPINVLHVEDFHIPMNIFSQSIRENENDQEICDGPGDTLTTLRLLEFVKNIEQHCQLRYAAIGMKNIVHIDLKYDTSNSLPTPPPPTLESQTIHRNMTNIYQPPRIPSPRPFPITATPEIIAQFQDTPNNTPLYTRPVIFPNDLVEQMFNSIIATIGVVYSQKYGCPAHHHTAHISGSDILSQNELLHWRILDYFWLDDDENVENDSVIGQTEILQNNNANNTTIDQFFHKLPPHAGTPVVKAPMGCIPSHAGPGPQDIISIKQRFHDYDPLKISIVNIEHTNETYQALSAAIAIISTRHPSLQQQVNELSVPQQQRAQIELNSTLYNYHRFASSTHSHFESFLNLFIKMSPLVYIISTLLGLVSLFHFIWRKNVKEVVFENHIEITFQQKYEEIMASINNDTIQHVTIYCNQARLNNIIAYGR